MIYSAMTVEDGEKYQQVEADLKMFTRSSVRSKVLLILLDEGKSVSELSKITNTRASTLLHSIKNLIELDLVEKKHQIYYLTNIGNIQAIILKDLIDTVITLNQHHKFWRNHDLSGIPLELQKRIGMLGKGEIVKDCLETPLKSLNYFLASIGTSKEIRGISPILITGYSTAISHLVENGSNVEIIVTKPVLDAILLENMDLIVHLLGKENFRLFKTDNDIKISFLVSESFLNLGLARVDGSYDLGTDLVYTGDTAIQWGRMLYDYYRSRSTQVRKLI